MDELERKVVNKEGGEPYEAHVKLAERGARKAWSKSVNLDPAYVEVLKINHGTNNDRYLVEIDGVRISAFHSTAEAIFDHYWDLDERFRRRTRLRLHRLSEPRILRLRRRRLRRKGVSNG